jgi:hypothetical protein
MSPGGWLLKPTTPHADATSSSPRMRDIETIDGELRLAAWSISAVLAVRSHRTRATRHARHGSTSVRSVGAMKRNQTGLVRV